MDVDNFTNSNTMPTQFVLLSQLNVCRFLVDILKSLRPISHENIVLKNLVQELVYTVQIIMKTLGEVTCMQKNRLSTSDFDTYIKTGEWQNLKQLIIRYDIEFREELKSNQIPKKGAVVPRGASLPQAISYLKTKLPMNARLVDKLIIYLEIRDLLAQCPPLEFAERVNMGAITRDALHPDNPFNCESALKRVS